MRILALPRPLAILTPSLPDEIDLKDLQYQVVLARRKAVQLITDINNAETKNLIKSIKDIENGPLNTTLKYTPMDVQKLRNIEIPERHEVRLVAPFYVRIIENSHFRMIRWRTSVEFAVS